MIEGMAPQIAVPPIRYEADHPPACPDLPLLLRWIPIVPVVQTPVPTPELSAKNDNPGNLEFPAWFPCWGCSFSFWWWRENLSVTAPGVWCDRAKIGSCFGGKEGDNIVTLQKDEIPTNASYRKVLSTVPGSAVPADKFRPPLTEQPVIFADVIEPIADGKA